jgi:uncharacterized membrane protein
MFYIGTAIIVISAIAAMILMALHMLGVWIFIPIVIGFIIQMIGAYQARPSKYF